MAKFDHTAHWANVARHFASQEKFMENAIIQALDGVCPDWRESYEKMDENFDRIFKVAERSLKKVKSMKDPEMMCDSWDRIVQKTFPEHEAEVQRILEEDRQMMREMEQRGNSQPEMRPYTESDDIQPGRMDVTKYYVNLIRNECCVTFRWDEWFRTLKVARLQGWIPYGTIPPTSWFEPIYDEYEDEDGEPVTRSMFNLQGWKGVYDEPLEQSVGEHDAAEMANYLTVVLEDLSPQDPIVTTLDLFVTFARSGGFRISFAN